MKNKERLLEIISEVLELEMEEINIEKNIGEYEDWDSLAHVQIVAEIIDKINPKIKLEDTMKVSSIKELLAIVGE